MKHILASILVAGTVMLTASQAEAMNCVAYVKAASNFSLMGDAWAWWDAAANVYERGYRPQPGAVMVFNRTSRMHVGHVALVKAVRGPREILIDQANWHHGRVDTGVSVVDISPNNDWSLVNVEWSPHVYGGPFPITGFVYNAPASAASPRFASPHFVLARMPATPPRYSLANLHRPEVRPASQYHVAPAAKKASVKARARTETASAALRGPRRADAAVANGADLDHLLQPASLLQSR